MEKIAMKITEEEFNSILPILKEGGKCINHFVYTCDWCYLIFEKTNAVELATDYLLKNYKLLPYNKNKFLKHCGITVEESFEEYAKRNSPYLFELFCAEKEFKNRKPICKTVDGVEIFGGESIYGVTDDLQLCHIFFATEKNVQPYRTFSTEQLAQEYIDKNKPQETQDGFQIKRGEVMWVVDKRFFRLHQSYGGHFIKQKGNNILFGKKENAENYILINKTTLSLSDLDNITFSGEEKLKIINIVKQRLRFS